MPLKEYNHEATIPSYSLTHDGYHNLTTRQRRLLRTRAKTLAEMRHLREEQASDPLDLALTLKQLQRIDDEIAYIDQILQHASRCPQSADGTACVGAEVTLRCRGQRLVILLVESIEADPFAGRISIQSPLGQAVIGKGLHERVEIHTAKGMQAYKIVAIK
ncbi:MAG TPA: GreA/GreB family elongation factor [Nevskiaceae bacterium]|nr:GreA/GreB family elongation factor [Nevskiaceae bacterium]